MRILRLKDWLSESSNDYYEMLPNYVVDDRLRSIYGGEIREGEWGDGEIRRLTNSIKDVIDVDQRLHIRYGGSPYKVGGVYRSTSDGTPMESHVKIPIYKNDKSNAVCIPTREVSYIIHKYDDEWYVVKTKINYGVMYKLGTPSNSYLCNGFDGLEKCLKNIIKEKSD